MKAVICAAGFGTRLKLNIPKAMVMINGKRIIDYLIKALKNYDEIYVVVGYRSNLILDHLKKHSNIKFIINDEPSLGIMHTMRLIAKEIDELALILDGDMIINDELPLYDHEFIGIRTPVCRLPIYVASIKTKSLLLVPKNLIMNGLIYIAPILERTNGILILFMRHYPGLCLNLSSDSILLK